MCIFVFIFLIVNKSPQKTTTKYELILLENTACVVIFCAIALHCCPKNHKHINKPHLYMFYTVLYCHEHGH